MELNGVRVDPRLTADLKSKAAELGFDVCRIAPPGAPPSAPERLERWLELGRHGEMAWMDNPRRADPRALWPDAGAYVMVGVNYAPDGDPLASTREPSVATISVYARNRDYHDVLKGRLKLLASWFTAKAGGNVKVFVDTAPLMEKPLAQTAGLGWQGKHTNLVSREFGSWLFLGALLVEAALPPDEAERDRCGTCRACLDACPTRAFPAPYQLDARRCISYLTIEHKGPIPLDLREGIGNRVYGCDDCLAVCPWNKFAKAARETKLTAPHWRDPPLAELAALDDKGFRSRFAGSPIKRVGRDRFLRNVMIAVGNSADANLIAVARAGIADGSALVRGAAIWALARLAPASAAREAREDPDPDVQKEWRQAILLALEASGSSMAKLPVASSSAASAFAVVVMGVSGAGKTTFGRALAEALGAAFIDGDDLHSEAARARMGAGVALTDDDRWPWLDRVGAKLGEGLAAARSTVVACSALKRAYRERIRQSVGSPMRFVYLAAKPEAMRQRVAARSGHYMPASLVDSQFAALEAPHDEPDVIEISAEADLAAAIPALAARVTTAG